MIKQTKFGWVDVSGLPIKNGKIEWKKCIGSIIRFKYKDIYSKMVICRFFDRNKNKVIVNVDGVDCDQIINCYQILRGEFGAIVNKKTAKYKYQIGQIVNGSMLITSQYKIGSYKHYCYICQNDGYEGHISEGSIARGSICLCCAGKVLVPGVNDIATTRPDIADLLWDQDDGTKYQAGTKKRVDFRCPYCGNKINAIICNVAHQGLFCRQCDDGLSYPNKFVYNFIKQLSDNHLHDGRAFVFTPEKTFPWSMNIEHENKILSGKKIYDIFIDTHNIIIENHGDYHYVVGFEGLNGSRTLKEVQENDILKRDLALLNGITENHYVVLNCSVSSMEYIKNSIMSSSLPMLLDFTEDDIDWFKCDKFATSSRVYDACCYWNNGVHNYAEIALLMKMHPDTIKRYIHKGRELNIIND